MDHHPHASETETSAGYRRETTTEARSGSRSSYGFVEESNAFHVPVAEKQCEPTHSNLAHCDCPCHREKGCLLLLQMAKAQSELRVRACHGMNEEVRR